MSASSNTFCASFVGGELDGRFVWLRFKKEARKQIVFQEYSKGKITYHKYVPESTEVAEPGRTVIKYKYKK